VVSTCKKCKADVYIEWEDGDGVKSFGTLPVEGAGGFIMDKNG